MGVKEIIRKIAGKIVGINQLQEQVETLYSFLNMYHDIRQAPAAEGALRDVQECDALLMRIFDSVCRKNGLTYWLDAGTLLGAVRHGGFIPWDDDVDVCMLRDDYTRAVSLLKEELGKYGIQAEEDADKPMGRIGIGYKHKQTGIWIDVFPLDYCEKNLHDAAIREEISAQIKKYRKTLRNPPDTQKWLRNKKRIFTGMCAKESAVSVFYTPEFVARLYGWNMDDIFPLQEIKFEECSYFAPAKLHEYLVEEYGADYMQFPKNGMLHHGDESGSLINWAKNSGTNMDEIKRELEEIINQLES